MNRTIKNQPAETSANHPVYYAPVASTRGDKVKIFRFGFNEEYNLFIKELGNEHNPLRQALLRYKMAKFIIDHIAEYSGDREVILQEGSMLAFKALQAIEDNIFHLSREVGNISKRLCELQSKQTASPVKTPKQSEREKGLICTCSTIDNKNNNSTISAAEKREIATLCDSLRLLHRRLNSNKQICPHNIIQEVINLTHIFENMGY